MVKSPKYKNHKTKSMKVTLNLKQETINIKRKLIKHQTMLFHKNLKRINDLPSIENKNIINR